MKDKIIVQKVLDYKNEHVVARYAKEHNVNIEAAEKAFEACKQFLFLCSIADTPLSPSKKIDDVWHEFLMFTRDYQEFCQNCIGRFIHHNPDVEMSPTSKKRNRDAFAYGRTLALSVFGDNVDADMWNLNVKISASDCDADCGGCSGLDGNCNGCNGVLAPVKKTSSANALAGDCGGCSGLDGNCNGCDGD